MGKDHADFRGARGESIAGTCRSDWRGEAASRLHVTAKTAATFTVTWCSKHSVPLKLFLHSSLVDQKHGVNACIEQ